MCQTLRNGKQPLTKETLLRKNWTYAKIAVAALILVNQNLVQITVCIPSDVYESADKKHEQTGQTIEQQVEAAMILMQAVERLLNSLMSGGA